MDWKEIKEVEKFDFATIGHHSHTHEYLIEMSDLILSRILKLQQKFLKINLDMFQKFFLILLENILNI